VPADQLRRHGAGVVDADRVGEDETGFLGVGLVFDVTRLTVTVISYFFASAMSAF
jgi:hypothetical protein